MKRDHKAQPPEQPKPCPLCKRDTLFRHCASGKCGWFQCRNKACDAIADFANKRGHVLSRPPSGLRRRIVFLSGGEVV